MNITNFATLLDTAFDAVRVAQRWIAFWGPVTSAPALAAPLLAVASVVMLAVITGIAIGSLASLLVALLALYFLLTEVFGVSVDLLPARM